jgi:predicted nucleic acid-binding protein
MLVVADTSRINYLILIQHELLLPALYTHVIVPPAVHHELQDPETPLAVRAWIVHPPAQKAP